MTACGLQLSPAQGQRALTQVLSWPHLALGTKPPDCHGGALVSKARNFAQQFVGPSFPVLVPGFPRETESGGFQLPDPWLVSCPLLSYPHRHTYTATSGLTIEAGQGTRKGKEKDVRTERTAGHEHSPGDQKDTKHCSSHVPAAKVSKTGTPPGEEIEGTTLRPVQDRFRICGQQASLSRTNPAPAQDAAA